MYSPHLHSIFTRLIAHSLDFVLPAQCNVWGLTDRFAAGKTGERGLCLACTRQVANSHPWRCFTCALPLTHDAHQCGQCLRTAPAFDRTVAAADYTAPLDHAIGRFKFAGSLGLASSFASQLTRAVRAALPPGELPEVLLPVPLAHLRLMERGYNQALEIARPLARNLGLPVLPRLLVRLRDTHAQTTLAAGERQANVRHAFGLNPRYSPQIQGRHVGVVDDVMTTGATLNEIGSLLRRHGASRVTNLVLARTPA